MTYLWVHPEGVLNKEIGVYDRACSPDRFLLQAARKLDLKEFSPTPVVQFEVPQKQLLKKYDCLVNNTLIPLVNERVKEILEDMAPNVVQFFPAKAVCTDGELPGYSFLNVSVEIVGIDHNNSVYSHIETIDDQSEKKIVLDAISGFTFLTYKHGCMGDYHLARDKEYHGNLLVSEKLKLIFDKEKITGARIVRSEEYYRPLSELL